MDDAASKGRRAYVFGDFVLDLDRAVLTRAGVEVRLRPKSFDVLRHLVEHAGRLVTKNELMDAVWGATVVTEGSLTQCIIDIRRALGDHDQAIVRTVPRRGYMFELPVDDAPTQAAPAIPDAGRSATSPPLPDSPSRALRPWMGAMAAVIVLLVAAGWWLRGSGESLSPSTPGMAAPTNSIAVLRFLDLSPTGDQGYFADGLAEEILHLLTQSPELRVTARTSSFAVQPGEADIRDVAGLLGVAHVLEGSVRRIDDDLRITAQLIDGRTGIHVWSRTYDRPFANILELQRDVAKDVAATLHVSLVAPAAASTPGPARAQELFLLGRHLFHRREPGDLEAAEGYLEEAVRLDPGHARAWTTLAGTYAALEPTYAVEPYRLPDQRAALEQAVALDPNLAEAHVRLARVHRRAGDHAAAEASFRRAIALAPNDPLVLHGQANRARAEGKLDEALEFERRAVAVNPLSSIYRGNFGRSLLGAGRLQEGLDQLLRARELSRRLNLAGDISRALLLLGRIDAAREEAAIQPPGPERDTLTVLLGDPPAAQAARSRLAADASFAGRVRLAEVAAFEGRADDAFGHLDAAATLVERGEARPLAAHEVYSSGLIGRLRSDARWPRLVERFSRADIIDVP